MAVSSEYKAWWAAVRRCTDPTNKSYKNYGGRGIKVCKRWKTSVKNFLLDMGHRPSKEYTLERKNNDGDYCPENCVWATRRDQQANRRVVPRLVYKGEILPRPVLLRRFGISVQLFRYRTQHGMSVEQALETPVESRSSRMERCYAG